MSWRAPASCSDPPERPGHLRRGDCRITRCPACREGGALVAEGGALVCPDCCSRWPEIEGLVRLYREPWVQGTDRLLRRFYDGLPSLHDPATRYLLPVMQSRTDGATREGWVPFLELEGLTRPDDGEPVRILEVGIGAGANLPLLDRGLPPGLPVEIWGLDLSRGMLGQCQRRVAQSRDDRVRLVLGDAHALPFSGGVFDRVFHVGAAGSFRDPALALAEMARVARPGTPIVVVDEQLDPARSHGMYHRMMFRMLTFYDSDPHCPVELLPQGATDVERRQVSRFYYGLRFRMPVEARGGLNRPRTRPG